jgi:hypothetical protein
MQFCQITGTLLHIQAILPNHWHTVEIQTILPNHWHTSLLVVLTNSTTSTPTSSTRLTIPLIVLPTTPNFQLPFHQECYRQQQEQQHATHHHSSCSCTKTPHDHDAVVTFTHHGGAHWPPNSSQLPHCPQLSAPVLQHTSQNHTPPPTPSTPGEEELLHVLAPLLLLAAVRPHHLLPAPTKREVHTNIFIN